MIELLPMVMVAACWWWSPTARVRMIERCRARFTVRALIVPLWALLCVGVAVGGDRDNTARWVLYEAGMGALLVWLSWAASRVSVLWLVYAGTLANFVVITWNRGMPARVPAWVAPSMPATFMHHAMTSADRLRWLGDVIVVPGRVFGGWYSIGDLLILVGLCAVLWSLMRSGDEQTEGVAA